MSSFQFIFDVTNDNDISRAVAASCEENEQFHFVLSRDFLGYGEWSFFGYVKYADYGNVIWQLM